MSNNLRTNPDDSADVTAPKQRGVPFKPGQSGNPAGRPRGARSRLGEAFLSDLANAWADHGVEAIEKIAKTEPGTFVKVVSNVLPKEVVQMAFSLTAATNLQEIEKINGIMAAYRYARDQIGAVPLKEVESADEGVMFTEGWAHGDD